MTPSTDLLARRPPLMQRARDTIVPLQLWWNRYGRHHGLDKPIPESYFTICIRDYLSDSEEEINTIESQHPRYITEKKLDDFESRYRELHRYWKVNLREGYLFEQLRAHVGETPLSPIDLINLIYKYEFDILEHRPLVSTEMAYLQKVTTKVRRHANRTYRDYSRRHWWDNPQPPMDPIERFELEQYLFYLFTVKLRVTTPISDNETSVLSLPLLTQTLPLEWGSVVSTLLALPLTSPAWTSFQHLQVYANTKACDTALLARLEHETLDALQAVFYQQWQLPQAHSN